VNSTQPTSRLAALTLLAGATAGCLVVLGLIAQPFVPALVWALTLGVLFTPLEQRLRIATRSPAISATTTLLVAGFVVVIPAIAVASTLLNQMIAGIGYYGPLLSPSGLDRLRSGHPRIAELLDSIDGSVDVPRLLEYASAQFGHWSGQLFQSSASGLITLLLTFYFLFYFLRDRERALAAIARLVPLSREEFDEFTGKTVQTVFASVYATLAVAALQGLLGGLMFWILGLPSPVFWGVVMGLLAIVPFLGAFVIWVPAAIGLALNGQEGAAIVLALWGAIVVGLIDNIVYPILVGKRLSLHPMISFIAIVGGLLLFGAHGIVLGPLIAAVAQALPQFWRNRVDANHGSER